MTDTSNNASLKRSGEAPAMPEFTRGTHAARHTIDSALNSLAALGVPAARIQVRRTGRNILPDGMVLAQAPAAGTPLTGDVRVQLDIAGLGFAHALPIGMWDSGGESEPGTWEMLSAVDDPLVKLTHWSREGAALFRISNTDYAACARWISLFCEDAAGWPSELWFRLATLLPRFHAVACSDMGMRLVLDVLFGLPVDALRYSESRSVLPDGMLTRLGTRASQLGVDTIVGATADDLARLHLFLGPVSLAVYEKFAEEENARLLRRTLDYILPAFQDYQVHWLVEDRARCPRLGIAASNSRLGLNTYLGKTA